MKGGRVRIRCAPSRPAGPATLIPSWSDFEIHVIDDAGREMPVPGVKRIELVAQEGTEPVVVRLDVYPEGGIELEGDVVLRLLEKHKIQRRGPWEPLPGDAQRCTWKNEAGEVIAHGHILSPQGPPEASAVVRGILVYRGEHDSIAEAQKAVETAVERAIARRGVQ